MINRKDGYSLLELMLGLSIAAMLTLGLIGIVNRQATSVKLERTAADIKLIFQAGIAYYQTYHTAPDSLETLRNAKFILPHQLELNPWGKGYDIVYDKSKHYFGVKTEVPSALYNRLAGLLPNVDASVLSPHILSYMTLPKNQPTKPVQQTNAIQYGTVRDVDIISAARDDDPGITQQLDCPNGQKPKVYVMPATFATGDKAYPITDLTAYAVNNRFNPKPLGIYQAVNRMQIRPPEFNSTNKVIIIRKCDPVEASLLPVMFK